MEKFFFGKIKHVFSFSWFDRCLLLSMLIFLFPVGVVSVRHWASNIFGLLIIVSIVLLRDKLGKFERLLKHEKVLLLILATYFLVSLATITIRGWDKMGVYAIGTESRFLLVIPFYLVVRRCSQSWRFLWAGTVVGIILSVAVGFYEHHSMGISRVNGVYGPLLFGPVLLLMIVLQLPWSREFGKYNRWNIMIGIIVIAGLYVVFLTGARSAYIALIVAVLAAFGFYFKTRNSVILLVIVCATIVLVYSKLEIVSARVGVAVKETSQYVEYYIEHPGQANKYGDSSVGIRFELWRAAINIYKKSPFVGVGRYHFEESLKEIVEAGLVNQKVLKGFGHPHNVFFEAMVSKGTFGLLMVLALYFYPLYFFIKTRNASRESAFAGILLMVSMLVFSLTEVAPVYFGNFVSVFLVCLAVIFSWHARRVRMNTENSVN